MSHLFEQMSAYFDQLGMLWKLLAAFVISMLPLVELRGGIIFSRLLEVPLWEAFLACFLGNILPVPFILLFLRQVFRFMERFRPTKRIVTALERRARKREGKLQRYRFLGLFLLVAIPLPGTGAWTGALVAVVFDMQIRKSFPVIALGVLGAGAIMLLLSYAFPSLFGFRL
ncbi:MAG: small multi-drug export protein [Oscillospiraceae bacterium]|jgi:uncharacterized membrane protein|nr:small multi-drug export protein [Oscillospiraceae bacterium]